MTCINRTTSADRTCSRGTQQDGGMHTMTTPSPKLCGLNCRCGGRAGGGSGCDGDDGPLDREESTSVEQSHHDEGRERGSITWCAPANWFTTTIASEATNEVDAQHGSLVRADRPVHEQGRRNRDVGERAGAGQQIFARADAFRPPPAAAIDATHAQDTGSLSPPLPHQQQQQQPDQQQHSRAPERHGKVRRKAKGWIAAVLSPFLATCSRPSNSVAPHKKCPRPTLSQSCINVKCTCIVSKIMHHVERCN